MTSYFTIKEHTIPGQYIREYPDATYEDEECELLIHVKQYVPSRSVHSHADAVTLLGAHANGIGFLSMLATATDRAARLSQGALRSDVGVSVPKPREKWHPGSKYLDR